MALVLLVGSENAATILRAHVVALAIKRSRVNHAEKMPQQIVQTNLAGVVAHHYRLGVASVAVDNLLVGGVCGAAIGITRNRIDNPREALEIGLNPPKTPAGKINLAQPCASALGFFYWGGGAGMQLRIGLLNELGDLGFV